MKKKDCDICSETVEYNYRPPKYCKNCRYDVKLRSIKKLQEEKKQAAIDIKNKKKRDIDPQFLFRYKKDYDGNEQ